MENTKNYIGETIKSAIDDLATVRGPEVDIPTKDAAISNAMSFLLGLHCMSAVLSVLREGQELARKDKDDSNPTEK